MLDPFLLASNEKLSVPVPSPNEPLPVFHELGNQKAELPVIIQKQEFIYEGQTDKRT